MPDHFANPAGFLGLLAIPTILLIHFLREKSQRIRVSTLFLLEELAPRTPRGQRLHRLQNSLSLWLQLLGALLCTWLLVEPRWVRRESTQRVNVILDDTASMTVSRDRVRRGLPETLRKVERGAQRTEWVVRTTNEPDTPLYRGLDLGAALAAFEQWQPLSPHHDPDRAFSLALLEARGGGAVIFVSDRVPPSLPSGVTLVAFGKPLENCGFAGVRAWRDEQGAHWSALVKNFGTTFQTRAWWTAAAGEQTAQMLSLAPGQIETISGTFDPGGRLDLRLAADEFRLDDVLPLIAPQAKPLLVFIDAPPRTAEALARLVTTTPAGRRVADPGTADVIVTVHPETIGPGKAAIALAGAGPADAKIATGVITTENHPWLSGLRWDGLLSSGAGAFTMDSSDEPLFWQGDKPLAFLRRISGRPLLFINFDLENSNAARLPAFVLTLSRFLAIVAEEKSAPFAENFDTLQLLPPPLQGAELFIANQPPITTPRTSFRAPSLPSFFEIRSGEKRLVAGAAHFGDPRESDFRDSSQIAPPVDAAGMVREENMSPDQFAKLWLVMIGAALAGSWAAQARGRSDEV